MARYTFFPWQHLQYLREGLEEMMEEEFAPSGKWGGDKLSLWNPPADAYETESEFTIEVELPGVDQERMQVETREGFLLVYGERRLERDVTSGAYQIMERTYGPFARRFSLPSDIDMEGVSARFKNGILTITVPKRAKSASRVRIKINE